jgi:hypothetical protein
MHIKLEDKMKKRTPEMGQIGKYFLVISLMLVSDIARAQVGTNNFAGQNSIVAFNINDKIVVDGVKYATLCAALGAVLPSGAIVEDPTIEAFVVTNPFSCTSNPVWVQFGAGTWTTTLPLVLGANQWASGMGAQATVIQATGAFASGGGVFNVGGGVQTHNSFVRDLAIVCTGITGCNGIIFDGAQSPAGASNVTIQGYTQDGVRLQQTTASTAGVALRDMWAYSPTGVAPTGSGVNISQFSGVVTVENFTQASDHAHQGPSAFAVAGGTGEAIFINDAGEGITDQFKLTGTSATTTIIGAGQQASSSPGVNTVHVGTGVSNYELINVSQGGSSTAALQDDQRSYTCTGGLPFLVVSGGSAKFDFGTCQTVGWIRTPAAAVANVDKIQLQTGFTGANLAYTVLDPSASCEQFGATQDGRIQFRGNQTGCYYQNEASDTLTAMRTVQYPNGTSAPVMVAALVTTAATTDNVTIQGMTASGHCTLTATNTAAATNTAKTYISAKAANQITVTHIATANMNYDIACTSN